MITVTTPGLNALKANIARIQKQLKPTITQGLQDGAIKAEYRLSMAAPNGKAIDDHTIPGDAPGKLLQSFDDKAVNDGIVIITHQSHKLQFVRYGTGVWGPLGRRIYPITAQALFWQGAAHPYRSVAGMRPNDFVSPALPGAKQDIRDSVVTALQQLLGGL